MSRRQYSIVTVVRSVLFRPLPYPESHRLMHSYDSFPGAGVERAGTSVPNYFDRRALTNVFEEVALYRNAGFRVGQGPAAEGVSAMSVTASFFKVLRTNQRPASYVLKNSEMPPRYYTGVTSDGTFKAKRAAA